MTISRWLSHATTVLHEAGTGSARLDALILLEDALRTDRAYILAHDDRELPDETVGALDGLLRRRARHEPLAYIRGRVEFYGREFVVNSQVLVPRPESEDIITLLTGLTLPADSMIVDVGTGSGALAITAKLELPEADVFGIDIDASCLDVARRNAGRLSADVTWLEGDLIEPLLQLKQLTQQKPAAKPLVLLCNLPYVPDEQPINKAAGHEPATALFAGTDGLDLYRSLFMQLGAAGLRPLYVITESMPQQHVALARLAKASGYQVQRTAGYIQLLAAV